jgi:hypothetical protein
MRRLLIPLALAGLVAAASAGAAGTAFTPAKLAGSWRGTWKNQTFGTTGPAYITVRVVGTSMRVRSDFGGRVFGCQDPPPEGVTILKGRGRSFWTSQGFAVRAASHAFGTLTIVYLDRTKTLRGQGINPTCQPRLKWTVLGQFAGRVFTGTVRITLPDGSRAVSKLHLVRS